MHVLKLSKHTYFLVDITAAEVGSASLVTEVVAEERKQADVYLNKLTEKMKANKVGYFITLGHWRMQTFVRTNSLRKWKTC